MGTGPNGEEKSRLLMVNSSSIATTGIGGYCYPNPHDDDTSSSNIQNNINFVSHQFDPNPTEMYNLTSGMEMVGFSSKNNNNTSSSSSVLWREFFNKPHDHAHDSSYQQHDLSVCDPTTTTTTTATASWNINPHQNRLLVDDHESLRSALTFPCQGNERPSQGLSLSLSSSNPSTIGIQSFELIPHHHDDLRFGPSSSRSVVNNIHQHFQIRNSKYLGPAQDLLSEFCNLGKHNDDIMKKKGSRRVDQVQDDGNAIKSQSLYSLDLLELQRRKTKLLHMLEEVDRRYKHYCDQMRSVVSSFEALAGNGAARVYSALASKAMSRHFRCIKDGIMGQIKATKKAMGEKDTAAPGTSKGETPRLRLLDQTLRQQRVFQQMTMMESHPWRPQRGLPERSVSVLRAWLFEHFLHPYPSDVDKHILARQTGLSRSQVSNWFINARVRLWKPMVEEMYLEELKDRDNNDDDDNDIIINNLTSLSTNEDQKPSHDELMMMRMESDQCLSSIVHHEKSRKSKGVVVAVDHHHHNGFGAYGGMEMDFASFDYGSAGANSYCGGSGSGSGSGSGVGVGGGVSLTLGLQHDQQGGSSSIFDQMEDQCQTVQYSLLDSDQSQTLPYRNLMGAQLLHDLAG